MLAAAQIAGLNVLSLMHDSTAFAFKYGFDNEAVFAKEKEPTNVVFYDLGATSYKASLVSFACRGSGRIRVRAPRATR